MFLGGWCLATGSEADHALLQALRALLLADREPDQGGIAVFAQSLDSVFGYDEAWHVGILAPLSALSGVTPNG